MQSRIHNRLGTAVLTVTLLILLCAGMATAGTESTNDPWLVFRTGTDTAAINDYEDDDTLFIPFQIMKADGDGSDTIVAVETRIIYDPDVLTLQSVDVNTTNWPFDFSYVDSTVNDTSYIFMLFEDLTGVGIPAVAQYTEMAVMQFTFRCVDSIGTRPMDFKQGTNLNWADYKLGGIFDPGYIIEGYAVLKDYWCDLWITDTIITQAIDSIIEVPVWQHNNYRTRHTFAGVQFDTSAMQYIGTFAPGGVGYSIGGSQVGDQVIAYAWNLSGFEGFDTPNVLYTHQFVLNCNAWGDTLTFVLTDTTMSSGTCMKIPVDLETEDGEYMYRDSAYYSASVVDTLPRYQGDLITYDIELTNLFPAGDTTAADEDIAGIVVNVDLGTFMEYDSIKSQDAEMVFHGTELNDYYISLFQVIDTAKDNYMEPGTEVAMMRMYTHMTDDPTTPPTWANPYITGPTFVDYNGARPDSAVVPNTQCDGEATFGNTLLSGLDFPPATAAVCQFYNYADGSLAAGCDELQIYAKANAAVDEIEVTLTVDSHLSIDDAQLATGITVTQNAYNSLTLESNGSFSEFGPNDSVYIASVTISCYSSFQNRYANMVYSGMEASYGSDELFTDASHGAVFVRCDIMCHDPDPVFEKPGNGLPTTYALYQNYPNPFNPTTQIQLDLPEDAAWRIEIYNMLGQLVKEFDGYSGAGTVSVEWNAGNHATGVYLYRATAGDFVETKKMLLLK